MLTILFFSLKILQKCQKFQNDSNSIINDLETSISPENDIHTKVYLHKHKAEVDSSDYRKWKKGTTLIVGDTILFR